MRVSFFLVHMVKCSTPPTPHTDNYRLTLVIINLYEYFNWIELNIARTEAQPVLAEVESRALINRQDEKKNK